jgi:hypothetical protein
MAQNFLQLNQDKTEVLIVGDKAQRENLGAHFNLQAIKIKHQVKNLGVILDFELNVESHIRNVTKIAFYHLRNLATVQPFLSQADTERLIHVFITSRFDYCIDLLSGLPKKAIGQLQNLQIAAARLLTKTRLSAYTGEHTPVLSSLHWLPVSFTMHFKIILLVIKSIHNCAPQYMSDMLLSYVSSRSLGSSGSWSEAFPKPRTKRHGEAVFSYYAPSLWNSLPEKLRR